MKLYLRLCPSQCEGAINGCWSPIFIREFNNLLSGWGDDGGKNNACSAPGRNADRTPQADYRVEYGADRIRKRSSIDDRYGVAQIMPAPDKPRAVCLELQVTDGFALHRDHVCGPNSRLSAARRNQSPDIRGKICLNE